MYINNKSIEEVHGDISGALSKRLPELQDKLNAVNCLLLQAMGEYQAAKEDYDSTFFQAAVDRLKMLQNRRNWISTSIEEIKNLQPDSVYVPTGVIKEYSTFRFKKYTDGKIYCFRVYPMLYSDLSIGVMSTYTRAYEKLAGAKPGDIVDVPHRIKKEPTRFEVLDVY